MNAPQSANDTLYLRSYQAIRLLGEGGMGQVFLGRHVHTGQEVVIKVMRAQLADDARVRDAFERELKVMRRFRHPNAVALLDGAWEETERPCLVLEYVRGSTLEQLLQRSGRLPPDRVGRLLGQVCQVLHAAHSMGILHRDLSAENLMIADDDGVKVMDFGLARLGTGFFVPLEKLTGTGNSIGGGTPDYMCPEQIRGEGVDQRGDLYSVGVLLFKMLTGRLPYPEHDEIADILLAHVQKNPLRFSEVGVQDVPASIEAVAQRCLCKYPNERPQSARELADQFGQALGQPIARAEDFVTNEPAAPQQPRPSGDELDRFEAWMPEQIAVVKLRGFLDEVGAEVAASEPGLIRVRLKDPRVKPVQEAPRGFLSFLGLGRRTLVTPASLLLELLMEKKQVGTRNLVEITVVLPQDPLGAGPPEEQTMRRGFGERICRELRAYLMIGR